MRTRPDIYIPGITAPTYVQKLTEQFPFALAVCGAVGVLLATLFPFDFYNYPVNDFVWDLSRHTLGNKIYDFLTNVILFIPFGLGVAGRYMRGGFGRRNGSVVMAVVLGLGLSVFVEMTQRYLPQRDASLVDLISNTTGALIGGLVVWRWGEMLMQGLPRWMSDELDRPSAKKVGAGLLIWLVWPLGLAVVYAGSLALNNWDPTAKVAIGNEADGGRQWHGKVDHLHVISRAVTKDEVARVFAGEAVEGVAGDRLEASYVLRGEHGYADRSEKQPPLAWQPDVTVDESGLPILTFGHWLLSTDTPRELTRAIRDAQAFTILTAAASADLFQSNDPRIATLSRSVYSRNVSLAQNEADLVIRIRNGVTGGNGSEPQFLVTDVFTDSAMHQIAVTYDRGDMRAYVDGVERAYQVKMTPAVAIVWGMFPRPAWALRMTAAPTRLHEWILYCVVFIPAAILTAVLSTLVGHRRRPWVFVAGVLLPPVVLQGVFYGLYQVPFVGWAAGGTMLLSVVVGVVALLRLKTWRRMVVSERV